MNDPTPGSGMADVIEDDAPPLAAGNPSESNDALDRASDEMTRLMSRAAILRPVTERLLRSAGLKPGMRVLDVGCGAGDVSMLVAEMVGPFGSVVGIDRKARVLATARGRARSARLDNIIFQEAALESLEGAGAFDCVVARHVLIHQKDPVAFLRAAARCVRHGGILALHEIDVRRMSPWYPPARSRNTADASASSAARAQAPCYDAGTRLFEHFFNAGLRKPTMGFIGNEATLAPTLDRRLATAVSEAFGQREDPAQICAWVRVHRTY
jgi:ubiquinone/menaquinone biosynthesis C-methylase UbiE